ncbi:MAG: sensor histidine kinase [Hydrogenophaga sp.]|nr:sensor histidine kinase [Hydrogenophaga sp.]
MLALFWCCLASTNWANVSRDLVVDRAWLEDLTGGMTWEDARRSEAGLVPFNGLLTSGYGHAPIWVRLRIDPQQGTAPGSDTVFLRIRPAYLDDIRVFDPMGSPAARPAVGDRHPLANQDEPATTFLLKLPRGAEPRSVWVRVQSSSTRLAFFEVLEPAALRASQSRIDHFGALYLGVIAVFVVWGLVQVLIRRESLLWAFIAYEVITLGFGFCLLGFAQLYLSDVMGPGTVDRWLVVLSIISATAVIIFAHFLLNELEPVVWRSRIMLGLIGFSGCLLLVVAGGYTLEALRANMLLILTMPIVFLGMAVAGRARPDPQDQDRNRLPKWMIVGYLGASLFFTLSTAAPALGLVGGSSLSLYVVLFYSLGTGMLMLGLLQYQVWRNAHREMQLTLLTEEAKRQFALERAQREDRERMLAMLGHELKTPLATMRMLHAHNEMPQAMSRQVQSSLSDMTNIVERVIQAGQVEAQSILLNLETCELGPLIAAIGTQHADGQRICFSSNYPAQSADIATATVDVTLIKMIVQNLVDNALTYSPPGERVHAELLAHEGIGGWELVVSNAIGKAGAPDFDQVFRKYYRNPKASYRSGSGLGLYLAQGLAKLMGGDLRYRSDSGRVHFHLIMPNPVKVSTDT